MAFNDDNNASDEGMVYVGESSSRYSSLKRIGGKPRNLVMLAVLVALAGLGVQYLSHAATPAIALEAEQGMLTNGATKVTDTAASGGASVLFRSAATPPPSPSTGSDPFGIKQIYPTLRAAKTGYRNGTMA